MADDVRQQLIPLPMAARLACRLSYGDVGGAGRIIGVAHVLAAIGPVYSCSADGSVARCWQDTELANGSFRPEANELRFPDGRPAISNLAVTRAAVDEAVRLLKSAGAAGLMVPEDPASPRGA